ncbi:hypothetical protein Tco_0974458 [Tanacetum coccineum]|uniref:Maturase K n=1 Tax=Tanacetum coccineum TaxID=301880 RepID=A0ABQ5EBM6_9ASTR
MTILTLFQQEPFVVKQDPGVNSSQSPPLIDHHCCYECGDSLDDIFCQRSTYERGKFYPERYYLFLDFLRVLQTRSALTTEKPLTSLIMENEHTRHHIPETKSYEFTKSKCRELSQPQVSPRILTASRNLSSPSPIPVEDSDSLMEEIDIFLDGDKSIPPGIESDDFNSEDDDNYTSRPEFESFHVDYPDSRDSTIDIPSPSGDSNKIYDPGICIEVESTRFLATLSPVIDTLIPFSYRKKNDKVFNHCVLASSRRNLLYLLYHLGAISFNCSSEKPPDVGFNERQHSKMGVRIPTSNPRDKHKYGGLGHSKRPKTSASGGTTMFNPIINRSKDFPDYDDSRARGYVLRLQELHILSSLEAPISKI